MQQQALATTPAQHMPPVALVEPSQVSLTSPAGMMMSVLSKGGSLDQFERMMDLQDRWERREAEKLYNEAFAKFKAEAVRVIRGRAVTNGPLAGRSYAELHDVVSAVTPALSKHGLSASWKLTRDEKDWIEVTCTIKHVGGHSESVSMGGPPDSGGAKNALQARASTKTYLERYTLKAICGVAESGEDDDGAGGSEVSDFAQGWIDYALSKKGDAAEFKAACKDARAAFNHGRDAAGLKAFNAAVAA